MTLLARSAAGHGDLRIRLDLELEPEAGISNPAPDGARGRAGRHGNSENDRIGLVLTLLKGTRRLGGTAATAAEVIRECDGPDYGL